ncbi:A kinase (PRKA) anchor protein 1b [Narcine bancroftii]|uniref:A kinase (PRKA) anchor protein 1b n=1 Tax=Narcine bancroftii TaxID=1343680 RepID=UPI00383194F2
MVLRLRNVFPYTLSGVLALLGWWWYTTRKKSNACSYNKQQLAAASEHSTKVREENCAAVEVKSFDTEAEIKKYNQNESAAKMHVVPTLQAEAFGELDVAENLFLADNVENNAQTLVADSSTKPQEVLFMPNVQGPIQVSPKVEKDGYLHQMVEKTSKDALGTQPPACSPFSVAKSSDNQSAKGNIEKTLPKIMTVTSSKECDQLTSDHHTMERPEPEGENAGNATEPLGSKTALNDVGIGPYLAQSSFCQESDQETQFCQETCFTDDSLSIDYIDKRVNQDEIEEAAAGLISKVILAAKEELFAQLDPCESSEYTTGVESNILANSTVDTAVLPPVGDVPKASTEVRKVNEEKCTVHEPEATPKSMIPKVTVFGDTTNEICKDENQGHSKELSTTKICNNSLKETNPVVEDFGCSACQLEDGDCEEYLSQTNVDLCNLEICEGLLRNCQATNVQSEMIGKEKLRGPKMSTNHSSLEGTGSKDCAEVTLQSTSQACTEKLQHNAINEKSSEELNVVTEDSGCSVCYSEDGTGGEDLPQNMEGTLENKTVALHQSAAGVCSLGQDPKHEHYPSLQDDTKLSANGGQIEEGAHRAGHLLLEMELDHSGGSDVNSMDSSDSGCTAGAAEGQNQDTAASSSTKDKTELTIWEVQVPKHLVGRLIGKQGRYVSFLKQTSGAKIYISTLPYTQDFQICHIEGSQQQVNKALNLIGKKFKELDLTNLYAAPPLTLPALSITSWLMLPDGVTVDVLVVNIVNAGHMFVQQHTHPTCHVLHNMDQQMYLLYSQPGIPTLKSPLEVGIICTAPAVDGAWWRAQVVAFFEETNEVEIRYVDYGGYERVKIDLLRQIRSDFVSLPFQGAEVLLDNIMPLPGEDHFSEAANASMDEMTRGAALVAQVTGYNNIGIPLIHLWSLVGDEVLFLNQILVEKGHAQWMESY